MSRRNHISTSIASAAVALLWIVLSACSSTRHVPAGKYLLDDVKIELNDSTGRLNEQQLMQYVRLQPNHKMLWATKFRLGLYNMSGNDSTKLWNRWMRKIGEAPVVYDSAMVAIDAAQLQKAMINAGFLDARVSVDTAVNNAKRKMKVQYHIDAGKPHTIRSVSYQFPNDTIRQLIMRDTAHFTIRPGDPLDIALLESQREILTTRLRNHGYFAFGKEFITFNADTSANSKDVDLTMTVRPAYNTPSANRFIDTHREYLVRNIYYVMDYDPGVTEDFRHYQAADTLDYKDITILYGEKRYLRPSVLYENCFIRRGEPYSLRDVNNTYAALGRLTILKFINIRFSPVDSGGTSGMLDAYILLTPAKSQSFSAELEGTNSEGDLGVAAGLTYSHRNLAKSSETLTAKVRGAYESLSGNLSGLIHDRYLELSAEAGINFPKFKAPLLRESFKRRIKASTEFNVSLNYQERPEYTRIISTAGWSYKWSERFNRNRHTFTPVDINYVYLPESTNDFLDRIAPDNPLLRYSYEDHFIMRMGYSFYRSNKRADTPWNRSLQSDIYTLRVNAEIAGNFLFALSSIFSHRSNFHEQPYKVFGIHYSQYAKIDGDFSYLHIFNRRNSLACHFGTGVGVPYGNSSILPFEKRFYGGGANGVRGWDVRTLGPGRFPGTNSVSDFINQCGDIRLDLSMEYRAKLFWVIEGALFVDAGNIWTIHNYQNQPGGMFKFNSFYKEIAAAYGAGIRLDFNYFLLRFDLGMKAHNPAMGAEPWPLLHPRWHRDSSFHFSIGYPF